MKRLIQYHMQDGSDVVVEVDETEDETGLRNTPASRSGGAKGVLVAAEETFEHAFHRVMPALKHITSALREVQPDTLDLELGVKFDIKGGAIIASTALEANITVKLLDV